MDCLPEVAQRALDRARATPLSYAVRLLRSPDGRILAVLGEAHMKLARASVIGKEVVEQFELRGVETFQRKQIVGGRALGVVITAPRTLFRILTLGTVRGSTIVDAKQLPSGYTVELERTKHVPFGLHVAAIYLTAFFVVAFLSLLAPPLMVVAPALAGAILMVSAVFQIHLFALVPGVMLRKHSWSWAVHPFLGILTLRDRLMADGTVQMLADHPTIPAAVVVMGRAHVPGYTRLLIEKHGFSAI
jgi:hypothetical protein